MATTSSLKLPPALKARVAAIADQTGQSAHGFMLEAIERHVEREERMRAFVAEAQAADDAIERGEEVYGADEVHAWMRRLASGHNTKRPAPWRR